MIEDLTPEEQILEDIDEAKWQESFARPESKKLFAKMANEVQEARNTNQTMPLEFDKEI